MGLDALALILIPSYSVHANWIGPGAVNSVQTAVDAFHAMAAFICILVVGSIPSIDPRPLAKTFPRVVILVVLASIVALCGGAIGGLFTGFSVPTLFLAVVPILGGGVNAGAVPLAFGHGDAFGDGVLAVLLPPLLIGNLTTIVLAGVLGYVGRWRSRSDRPAAGMRL